MNTRMRFLKRYIINGSSAPAPTTIFTYYNIGTDELSTESYIGTSTSPIVPIEHNSNSVYWIGSQTFSNNTNVTSVTITNGIESIL